MADKQSGAKAEASSRGLILRVLSPEEPLCLLFLFPFPIGIEGSHRALQSSLPVHTLYCTNRCHKLKITQRTLRFVWRLVSARVDVIDAVAPQTQKCPISSFFSAERISVRRNKHRRGMQTD